MQAVASPAVWRRLPTSFHWWAGGREGGRPSRTLSLSPATAQLEISSGKLPRKPSSLSLLLVRRRAACYTEYEEGKRTSMLTSKVVANQTHVLSVSCFFKSIRGNCIHMTFDCPVDHCHCVTARFTSERLSFAPTDR